MAKMHYFSYQFSKIAPLPSILVTWSCAIWPYCGFSIYYDETELKKNQLWRHL